MNTFLTEAGFGKVAAVLAGLLCLLGASSLAAAEPPADAITFDTLTVRGTIYTRVVVVDVSKRHVSFRSAQGFSTVLLEDLDADARTQLARGGTAGISVARTTNAPATENNPAAIRVKAREKPNAEAAPVEEPADSEDATTAATPVHWTVASISGIGLFGLGCLTLLAGQVWMIVAGFRVSPGWGIALIFGTFVAGIITSMFCRSHWDVAKSPVCVKAGGVVLVVAGWRLWGQ
jgi:hypothetical protein